MNLSSSEKLLVSRLRALPENERIVELSRAITVNPALRSRQEAILAALEVPGSTSPFSPAGHLSSEALGTALQAALDPAPPTPKADATS